MNGVVISGPKRFLYGGLGSLLPTLYALAMGRDFENIFAHPTWASVLGWLVRTAALFAIGGLTVIFLKRNLKSISMIFLTGVVAPGIVRAVVSQDGAAVFTSPPAVVEAKDAAAVEEAPKAKKTAAPASTADGPVAATPPRPPVRTQPAPTRRVKSPMTSFLVALRG
jgi:energy-coupling factor transporter transmembrane protein EcfT